MHTQATSSCFMLYQPLFIIEYNKSNRHDKGSTLKPRMRSEPRAHSDAGLMHTHTPTHPPTSPTHTIKINEYINNFRLLKIDRIISNESWSLVKQTSNDCSMATLNACSFAAAGCPFHHCNSIGIVNVGPFSSKTVDLPHYQTAIGSGASPHLKHQKL